MITLHCIMYYSGSGGKVRTGMTVRVSVVETDRVVHKKEGTDDAKTYRDGSD